MSTSPDRRSFLIASAGTLALVGSVRAADKPGRTKNTKFAVNVEMWWRKEKDFLKRLEAAAALGFPAVEFWPFETKNVPAAAPVDAVASPHAVREVVPAAGGQPVVTASAE